MDAGTLLVTGSTTSNTTVNSGGTLGGTGNLAGTVLNNAGGTVAPGVSPGILSTGSSSFLSGSSFVAELNGPYTTAGTDYDQLGVTGVVNLGGSTLSLQGGAAAAGPGLQIVLIDNDGVDTVTGTFQGLPEGAPVSINSFSGQISYSGGSGNDVVLLPLNTPTPTATNTSTPTATSTATPTVTATHTATSTPTPTNTDTPTATPTFTATDTATPTPTPTNTDTPTATPTETATNTATPTPTPTNTDTPTATPTETATNTATPTPTPTGTATSTATATSTPTPSATAVPGPPVLVGPLVEGQTFVDFIDALPPGSEVEISSLTAGSSLGRQTSDGSGQGRVVLRRPLVGLEALQGINRTAGLQGPVRYVEPLATGSPTPQTVPATSGPASTVPLLLFGLLGVSLVLGRRSSVRNQPR